MYECECSDKQQTDSKLKIYDCAILNDFELYNVHAESTEIERWSILTTKVDKVEHNRKVLPSNRENFYQTEGICQKVKANKRWMQNMSRESLWWIWCCKHNIFR